MIDLTLWIAATIALVLVGIISVLRTQIRQRRQAQQNLRQQTERERLVNQIAQHIRQSLNLDEVLATTVADVREFLLVDRVLIYQVLADSTGQAITEAVLDAYPAILGQTFPAEVFPPEYHLAYSQGKIRAIADIETENIEPCLKEFVQQFGVRAKLVVPIIQQLQDLSSENFLVSTPYLWGLLIAHNCRAPRVWQPLEIELMQQLATQVAIAIRQSELHTQLQKLNVELEERVKQRTEELARTNLILREEIQEKQRTEIALRHTNQTLQSLIAASPRAIFTLDLQGKVQMWNPAAARIFGWTEAEVLGHPNPVISEADSRDYLGLWQKILAGIAPPSLEIKRQRKDGTPVDIVLSAAPLTNQQEEISGLVAVVADISEQKKQAEQVRLLQSVVVNTKDAVMITEAEPIEFPGPRILYVNQAFTTMTGYSLEEVVGKTPRLLQGAKTDRQKIAQLHQALLKKEAITLEIINYRKNGTEFWVELSLVPVADKTGHYSHWISVQRDITERKSTEEALRQSEERFRSLIENSLDIITILAPNGIIYYENPSVEKVLGYLPEQSMGQNFFSYIHPEDLEQVCRSLTHPIADSPIEFRRSHQDGQWRTFEALPKTFTFASPLAQIVMHSRDITERKRLDEVRLALEQEKELSSLKTRFFSMVSHEFRTPLSTVLAAAQLLDNSPNSWENSEKRQRNLQRIQDSVKNMVQLLDDILTINRAETRNLEFNPEWVDLERFVRHFLEEMQLSAGAKYTLNFTCYGKPTATYSDEKLLRSILANLLSNAIKYSPNGGQISCSVTFEQETVALEIQDWGLGIPREEQEQLFEPFYRGKNVRHLGGTGLGLAVVQKCVDLQGGTIEIFSEVNRGTIVTITLPIVARKVSTL